VARSPLCPRRREVELCERGRALARSVLHGASGAPRERSRAPRVDVARAGVAPAPAHARRGCSRAEKARAMRRERSPLPRPADPQSAGTAANRLDREAREPGCGSGGDLSTQDGTRVTSDVDSSPRTVPGRRAELTADEILAAFREAGCSAPRAASLLRVARKTFDRSAKACGVFPQLGRLRAEKDQRERAAQDAKLAAARKRNPRNRTQ
jgi:hypothetical protein